MGDLQTVADCAALPRGADRRTIPGLAIIGRAMHILIGFFVAAVLLYWWARGSVIVAILGTLFFVAMIAVSDNPFPLPAFLTVLGIAASWAPYAYKWRKRRVTFLAPAATVATQFRR